MSAVTPMPIPLAIDTDPGVDDAVALLLALNCPELAPRAVTTVFGNVELETTTTNARRVLALAGRSDIPVASGAARPLVHPGWRRAGETHHSDGLGGRAATFPEPGPLDPRGAVELLVDVLRAAERPVTLTAIGPLTNVALLLATHPEVTSNISRIVVMGGAIQGGNVTPFAEFNVRSDPEAAHRVLAEEPVPVTLVPLDVTLRCAVNSQWLAELAQAGPRCATLAGSIEHYHRRYRALYGADMVALHDAVAVLEAALPGTVRTEPMPIRVCCSPDERRGALLIGDQAGDTARPVDVAVDADIRWVHTEILRRLRALDS